jgi:hypothetical protein
LNPTFEQIFHRRRPANPYGIRPGVAKFNTLLELSSWNCGVR